jgi:hypothetical protein
MLGTGFHGGCSSLLVAVLRKPHHHHHHLLLTFNRLSFFPESGLAGQVPNTNKMASVIEQLDALIADTLSAWNLYTTLIALALFAFVAYPLIFWAEPDTHPLLLARQAAASPVRQPRESAVYRSTEVPHGYALKTGLSVREPGAPKWTAGRDGDLRDIWREAVNTSTKPTIITIHGTESIYEHDYTILSKLINIIGSHLQKAGVQRVAIYLPNSVEYLITVFGKPYMCSSNAYD